MSNWISIKDRLPTKKDADIQGYVVVLLNDKGTDFCNFKQVESYNELQRSATHWIALTASNDSEVIITNSIDQIQILKNALELSERENERLKHENNTLRGMIDNGLGWEDMRNDNRLYNL